MQGLGTFSPSAFLRLSTTRPKVGLMRPIGVRLSAPHLYCCTAAQHTHTQAPQAAWSDGNKSARLSFFQFAAPLPSCDRLRRAPVRAKRALLNKWPFLAVCFLPAATISPCICSLTLPPNSKHGDVGWSASSTQTITPKEYPDPSHPPAADRYICEPRQRQHTLILW